MPPCASGRARRGLRSACLCLATLLALTSAARAQFPMMGGGPQQDLLYINARIITMTGEVIENGQMLVSGKKIRAVGQNLETAKRDAAAGSSAEGAQSRPAEPKKPKIVDLAGKTIMPVLIDPASVVGLDETTARGTAASSVLDRVDLFGREDFADVIAQGVGYVYVGAPVQGGGVGTRGAVLATANSPKEEVKEASVSGGEAIEIAVGQTPGPISRLLEVKRLVAELKAARQYEEQWEQYKEALAKYEKALAEKAKKGDAGATSKPAEPKPDETPKVEAPRDQPGPRPGPRPFPRPRRSPELQHDHDGDGVDDHDADACTHPPTVADPFYRDENGVIIGIRTKCPVCGGAGHNEQIHGRTGFDFFEFEPDMLAPEGEPQKAPDQPGTQPAKDDQKPQEPQVDEAKAQLLRALNGKVRVRIQVDRAEDIINVLAVLREFPMEATLVGAVEGWMVAPAIAESGYPVIVASRPVTPLPEQNPSRGRGLPNLPPGLDFESFPEFPRPGREEPSGSPLAATTRNAAALALAGVTVAVGSVGEGASATAQVLLGAAYAAGSGLARHEALAAVTKNAARVVGLGESLGTLEAGKLASFLVLSGDPFAADTAVEQVFIDGKRVFKK